ncbi:MAG: BACON domain-containing protein [Micrococcales bacterium]|nr:BACON domain-containing protein [Micrococcales bacterium]
MKTGGRARRLLGVLSAVGWVAVCVLVISVQITRPLGGAYANAAVEGPAHPGAQGLSVDVSSWAVGAQGGEKTVTVLAEQGWQALSDRGWLQVAYVEGQLLLTAEPNAGGLRAATVMVTSGRDVAMVEVAQEGLVQAVGEDATATPAPTPSPSPSASAPAVVAPPVVAPPVDPPPVPLNQPDVRGTVNLVFPPGWGEGSLAGVTGHIVDVANPGRTLSYQVYGVYSSPGGREEVHAGRGSANRPEAGVGNHGYAVLDIPTTRPNDMSLLGVCVYHLGGGASPTLLACKYFMG